MVDVMLVLLIISWSRRRCSPSAVPLDLAADAGEIARQ